MTVTENRPAPARFRPEPAPSVAVPSMVLFLGTFALWGVTLWATLAGDLPTGAVIAVNAGVTFLMFTVVHESTHHAMGRSSLLNEIMGRASMLWFAGYAGFGLFRWIHIEHHRNTNEDRAIDPDAWAKAGSAWALPLRWATLDFRYAYLWFRRRRPRAERAETIVLLAALVAGIVVTSLTGTLWTFAIVYLIPQRIGLIVLAWWFDWLPHHGLETTQRQDRYKATRIRAGWEPALTTLLVYQNYHLVHHLYPSVPFYRYIKTWRSGLSDFLAHEPPIMNKLGNDLTVDEYRAWRGIVERFDAEPDPEAGRRAHHLTVSDITRLTDDAVAITLVVPTDLSDTYAFRAGQHVTVAAGHAGIEGRRTYSLCSPAPAGAPVTSLRIGVKQLDGGQFSTWASSRLAVGDTLEVAPPTGRFSPPLQPGAAHRYVMVAAGSGITPVLSVLATVLATQPDSRCTLLYGNRTPASTMFADEIEALASQSGDRLSVHHLLTAADGQESARVHAGRIDARRVADVLAGDGVAAADVDHWLVCGPEGLIADLGAGLAAAGVADDRIHRELFHVSRRQQVRRDRPELTATVSVTNAGGQITFDLASNGESILDAGLREMADLPYSCIAGACGTCRARLCSGTVDMETDAALSPAEREAGYVLTCQSHPTSEAVVLTYDE